MEYSIVTTDWNPEQTVSWMKNAHPVCDGATFRLLGDPKQIDLRCGGQPEFLRHPDLYETDNILYMDTDIVLSKNPAHIFDDMGDAMFAAPLQLSDDPFFKQNPSAVNQLKKEWGPLYNPPVHVFTCMMAFKGVKHMFKDIYEDWMKRLRYLEKSRMFDGYVSLEVGMSFTAPWFFERSKVYPMPPSTLNNLARCRKGSPIYKHTADHLGKTYGSMTDDPVDCTALHYHRPVMLDAFGLSHLIK